MPAVFKRTPSWLLLMALTTALLPGCTSPESSRPGVYVTHHGLGPDKWATAWLLKRHIDPGAEIKVVPPGAPLTQGIPFDAKDAPYRRQADKAAFEVARERHALTDPAIMEMAAHLHAIEVNFWKRSADPDTTAFEAGFRDLQQRHGRDRVTPECYLAYFDRIYRLLVDGRRDGPVLERAQLAVDCPPPAVQKRDDGVRELPITELLAELNRGKKVVFVDVREPEEFTEGHIPGAVNLPLRDVDAAVAGRWPDADYVVSYCIKDFRGFEMARTLKRFGVSNAVILNPYGISGWVASGLPVAGARSLSEQEARRRLGQCAEDPGRCLEL